MLLPIASYGVPASQIFMEEDIIGMKVRSKRGEDNVVGKVIEDEELEGAKTEEKLGTGNVSELRNMVAVQWYNTETGEEEHVGWHKKGALYVVENG